MATARPDPRFYHIDTHTLVLDCSAIDSIEHQHKQRMVNHLANTYINQGCCIDVVSAHQCLTLYCAQGTDVVQLQQQLLTAWHQLDETTLSHAHHDIPVHYGGEYGIDLEAVAEASKMSVKEVIKLHSSALYEVDFLGFQPGFAYISGLPKALHLPRLDTPRTEVKKGTVAIAHDKTAIYPAQSPGGWNLIGYTDMCLFDKHNTPPALFAPGDTIRFVEVNHD